MTEREALKLALEALKAMQMYAAAEKKGLRICDEAIIAAEEALAQPEQIPPSAYSNTHQPEREQTQPDKVCIEDDECPTEKAVLQRFWRENKKTQPEQEPVACVGPWHDGRLTLIPRYSKQTFERDQPLYTHPAPQRTWVGLTEEDMFKAEEGAWYMDEFDEIIYAKNIEAKLKEKNT